MEVRQRRRNPNQEPVVAVPEDVDDDGDQNPELIEDIPQDPDPHDPHQPDNNHFEAPRRLIAFGELPQWLRDNEHILLWHRPPLPSFRLCLSSIFQIHGETVNIWSHLIGAIVFFVLWMRHLVSSKSTPEKASFSAFFVSAVICMGCSAFLHITCCHSKEVASLSQVMDYVGIGILVVGSFVPWIFYAFFCNLPMVMVYLVSIFIMGVISVVVSLHPRYTGPSYRGLRAALFIALGLSGVIPTLHSFATEGIWKSLDDLCIGWLAFMAAFYIAGAVIYAIRIPERFSPGRFDLILNSHQLFHFAVLAGAYTEYIGITQLAKYRYHCEKIGTCHCEM